MKIILPLATAAVYCFNHDVNLPLVRRQVRGEMTWVLWKMYSAWPYTTFKLWFLILARKRTAWWPLSISKTLEWAKWRTWHLSISRSWRFSYRYLSPSHHTHLIYGVSLLASLFVQGAFPMKIKGIHFVNHSWLLKIIISMIWPFLSNKLRARVSITILNRISARVRGFNWLEFPSLQLHFHNNYSSLHKKIDPACLPTEYGGDLGPLLELGTAKEVIKPSTNIFDCLDNCKIRTNV